MYRSCLVMRFAPSALPCWSCLLAMCSLLTRFAIAPMLGCTPALHATLPAPTVSCQINALFSLMVHQAGIMFLKSEGSCSVRGNFAFHLLSGGDYSIEEPGNVVLGKAAFKTSVTTMTTPCDYPACPIPWEVSWKSHNPMSSLPSHVVGFRLLGTFWNTAQFLGQTKIMPENHQP